MFSGSEKRRDNAPITIVEFADLQCPSCRAGYPKVKEIVSRANGKIRMIFRHFPLSGPEHNMALPAAAIAEYAATKDKFYDFVSAIYAAEPEKLIEQLRGTLMVKSDHGTVWTIRFPTAIAVAAQAGR